MNPTPTRALLASIAVLASSPLYAVTSSFTQLLTFEEINFDSDSSQLVTGTTVGTDGFFLIRGGALGQRYVKISDVVGAKTASIFGSSTFADPDVTSNIAGDMDPTGNTIAANDPSNDIVFTLDAPTGAFTKLLSNAAGQAYSAGFNPTFGSLDPADGTYVVYDTTSDTMARVAGGVATLVLTDAELTTLISDDIPTSVSVLSNGNWLMTDADGTAPGEAFYIVDPVAKTSVSILSEAQMIAAITAAGGPVITDVNFLGTTDLIGPDGRFYWADTSADAILSIDPLAAIPADTIQVEFLAGAAGEQAFFLSNLVWVDGGIGWVNGGTATPNLPFRGLYKVGAPIPEPSTFAIGALAGLAVLAVRRKS